MGIARLLKIKDNVNTDYIISGRYKFSIQDPAELARHIFEDIQPGFAESINKGDFLVGGENFGCGSSREQAPLALKFAGFKAVIAKSFARIFYRNSINIGLTLIECDTDVIEDKDILRLDMRNNRLIDVTKNCIIPIAPMPKLMRELLKAGGAIEYFKKYGGKFNA